MYGEALLTVSVSGGPGPNSQLGSKGHFVAIIFSHFTLNDIAIFIVHFKKNVAFISQMGPFKACGLPLAEFDNCS